MSAIEHEMAFFEPLLRIGGKRQKTGETAKKKSASARRFFLPFFLTAEHGPRLAFFKPSMQIANSVTWNKKKQRLTFPENCPKLYTVLLEEEKRQKQC